jgi:mannosyltransferase
MRKAYPRGAVPQGGFAQEQRSRENRFKPSVALYLCFSALIVLLSFFLRFHNLGAQSLWNDEGSSYVQATRSFAEIADNAARDIHPPGYYWLLAVWRQVTGDSEFALRSLSAFASVLTVAFTYALGKRLFNAPAGLIAALFVTLNTFSIYYAQEARMYALLALWSVMGMWALARELSFQSPVFSFQKNRLGTWLALALINAAGLYTQYAYPFVMLAQGVTFLIWLLTHFKTGNWRLVTGSYIAANILTILIYVPWLPTALGQITQWPSTGDPIPPGESLQTIFSWFAFGMIYPSNSVDFNIFDSAILWLVLVSIFLIIVGILRWLFSPSLNSGRAGRLSGVGSGVKFSVPFTWVLLPVTLFLILGLFRTANLKFLLPSQIGFALLMGLGISGWWIPPPAGWLRRFHKEFALLALVPLVIYTGSLIHTLYTDPAYQRPDYREMVRQITNDPRPGDAVILDAPNQEEVFRYYYKNDAPVYPLPPGLGGNDTETSMEVLHLIDRHERIFVLFWGEAERDPNHVVEQILDSQTFQAGIDQWYGDVRFVRYQSPADMPELTPSGTTFGDDITLLAYALNTTTLDAGDVLQAQFEWQTDTPLTTPYKVFLQLLNSDRVLAAQRDSEPGGGSQPTTLWLPDTPITDRHGLTIPTDLQPGAYKLIIGLYNRDDPTARLPVDGGDYLELGTVHVVDEK